jgi:hypothetical protein
MIVWHLHDPMDFLAFASLSPACKAVAMQILKYPHLDGYRLLKAIPQPPMGTASDIARLNSGEFEANANSGNVVVSWR